MFLNKKEVHHLLPSLELKAKKKKKKEFYSSSTLDWLA